MEAFLKCFIPLFVAMNVPGNIPVFLGFTEGLSKAQRQRIGWQASLTALLVAIAFVFVGQTVLNFLHVTPADFKVAGGVVLFILAVRWILPGLRYEVGREQEVGAVPLGVPVFVGPASLTTLLIQVNVHEIGWVLASLFVNISIMWIACRYAIYIANVMGLNGMRAFAKVTQLLLAALGVMMVRRGLEVIFAR
ncbi:MAG: MarC family protein [Deltaproteobacteria bacterium]|nr:MarC family protein [Deltaproteobacteria bacterium]